MNHTKIPWVKNPDGSQGYTLNPLSGCLYHTGGLCKGGGFPCYVYRLANTRLKEMYLSNKNVAKYDIYEQCVGERIDNFADPFYPRFWPERLKDIKRPPYPFSAWVGNAPMTNEWAQTQPPNYHARAKKKGIFTCDMSDLFGVGIPEEWTRQILDAIRLNGLDRFYLLGDIKASVKYISIEPLLSWGDYPADKTAIEQWAKGLTLYGISWLIIGSCTGTKPDMESLVKKYPDLTLMQWGKKWTAQPKIEWVKEIVKAADKADIAVLLKNNLDTLIRHTPLSQCTGLYQEGFKLRQEIPK